MTTFADIDELRALAKLGASFQHLQRMGIMLDPPHGHGTLWECKAERCVKAREVAWTPEERAAKEHR